MSKSKEELRRDGQYRSDRHRDRDIDDGAIAVTGSPELLASSADDLAHVAFHAVAEALPPGTVGAADSMGLTILATTWSQWLAISKRMEMFHESPESDQYNRLFRQQKDCEKQIRTLSSEFGLTPKSRSQIKLTLIKASAEKSTREELDDLRDALDHH